MLRMKNAGPWNTHNSCVIHKYVNKAESFSFFFFVMTENVPISNEAKTFSGNRETLQSSARGMNDNLLWFMQFLCLHNAAVLHFILKAVCG